LSLTVSFFFVQSESVVFKEADGIPSAKSLTFFRTTDFEVQAQYATPQQLAAGSSLEVGKYLIKGIKPSVAGKPVEVKLKVSPILLFFFFCNFFF